MYYCDRPNRAKTDEENKDANQEIVEEPEKGQETV
jgi:hypothetical protein